VSDNPPKERQRLRPPFSQNANRSVLSRIVMTRPPTPSAVQAPAVLSPPAAQPTRRGPLLPLAFGLTLFLSAGLLFLIQPMLAKMLLPLLGGTPAVWNTCMLFFQALLLAGYAYAHVAPRWLGLRSHMGLHAVLLLLPLLMLPIAVSTWIPPAEGNPAPWLLGLLLVTAGLPFFVLSTTSPLLQRWFAQSGHSAGNDPYFLYGASNVGSMAALLCYPLLVEPEFTLAHQAWLWRLGYLLLAVFTFGCAFLVWVSPARREALPAPPTEGEAADGTFSWGWRLYWAALAFVPSSVMLGVTTHITTDIAPVPLFWVVPLAIYLFTLILAFTRVHPILRIGCFALLPVVILVLTIVVVFRPPLEVAEAVQLHLAALFLVCMVCHGELARTRPPARHLTGYYLWMSLGGMLGGLFNALLAPLLFDRVLEYPLMVVAALFLVPRLRKGKVGTPQFAQPTPLTTAPAPAREARSGRQRKRPQREPVPATPARPSPLARLGGPTALLLPAFGFVVGIIMLGMQLAPGDQQVLFQERNFFGVVRILYDRRTDTNQMYYGTTLHGVQSRERDQAREPLLYFSRTGPIGQVFTAFSGPRARKRVALVGLGTGTLACYAEPGQHWIYYEIDPTIERVAWEPRYFSYLSDARRRGVHIKGQLGDARLHLERSQERYGLIVLDAFSSDAIPIHLLTREALQVYLDHLEEDGILAFHLSSRYLRLPPVLAALARDAGLAGLIQDDTETDAPWKAASIWIVLARSRAHLGKLVGDNRWQPLSEVTPVPAWTDDYSNVLSVLMWGDRMFNRLQEGGKR
jgi:spermidine synthase